MGDTTHIAWTDRTMNFWVGCTKVSAGCDHCYAETYSERYRVGSLGTEWGVHGTRHRTSEANWKKPYRWEKEAITLGKPIKVFCSSLSDVFDNHPSIQQEWRDAMWQTIRDTPHLIWQLLTKRPQNVQKYLPKDWGDDGYPNVWMGYTVESQEALDKRSKYFGRWGYVKIFFSCEPLLSDLNLKPYLGAANSQIYIEPRVDWIIVGGESGNGHREMKEEWVRSIRNQCVESGTPFFLKQWGGNRPGGDALLDGIEYREFPHD